MKYRRRNALVVVVVFDAKNPTQTDTVCLAGCHEDPHVHTNRSTLLLLRDGDVIVRDETTGDYSVFSSRADFDALYERVYGAAGEGES